MASGVLAATSVLPDAAAAPRPRARWWTWAAVAGLFALGAAGVGYLVTNEVHVNSQFDQAHASLDRTSARFGAVLGDLAAVRRTLGTTDGQVGADATSLSRDTAQLEGVETALALARANVSQQGSAITDLQTCLGGVEQSLNALAVGDLNTAIAQLSAVAAPCRDVLGTGG